MRSQLIFINLNESLSLFIFRELSRKELIRKRVIESDRFYSVG